LDVHALAEPLAYLGAALGIGMVVPQVLRTLRHPGLPGVSALSWGLMSLSCLTWFAYGLRTAAIPQLPGNALLVTGAVAIVLLVPSAHSRRNRIFTLASAAALLVVLATVLPAQTVGFIAFSISLCSAWPQLIESFGTWRAGAISGVSLTTLSVRLVSTLCWMAYAILAFDLPVIISASFGLMTSLAIFGMEASLRLNAESALGSASQPQLETV